MPKTYALERFFQMKVHYEGAKIVVTLYCFLKVHMFELQSCHVIKKIFHNFFAYYGRPKHK
jgi:hypothetical protein